MGEDDPAFDGHDLLESVQGHVAPLSQRQLMEEGRQHLVKDTGAWEGGVAATETRDSIDQN